MRKITLFFLMLIMGVGGVNAKTTSTTLWEGTDDGSDIFISKTSLVAVEVLTSPGTIKHNRKSWLVVSLLSMI